MVKLPNDFAEDLPGLPEGLENAFLNATFRLPDDSDMDPDQIEPVYQYIADKICREMVYEWGQKIKNKNFQHFTQLEKSENYYHLHCLFERGNAQSMVVGRYMNQMKKRVIDWVYAGITPTTENWMHVVKTSRNQGANKTYDEGYIPTYLLPKSQSELQWAWTSMPEYIKATLNLQERSRLVKEFQETLSARRSEKEESGFDESGAPSKRSKSVAEYMSLVDWLVENGITTEKQWIQENKTSYLSYNASSSSRSQIKSALENACKVMSLTKEASDYLIGRSVPADITRNRIWRIFWLNGYDPAYAGSVLVGWCRRQFGKRNTVWLYGPATTGKTNIAEAVSHAVPFYGCVNWTNENFPFNDCVDKMIIWWEEGRMTTKVVESAKAILGGSKVRVDQKCKSSQQIDPTPVIVTSNTNMCIVADGNTTTYEHQQPLEDRMFKFTLNHRLPDDFGKVTKDEVKEFFAWANAHLVPVNHEFNVSHRPKRILEEEEPQPEAKRPLVETVDSTPSETDIRDESPPAASVAEPEPSETDVPVTDSDRYLSDTDLLCKQMNLSRALAESDLFRFPTPMVVHDYSHCPPIKELQCNVDLDDVNKEQ